jgi:inward rectifier potassium channel
MASSKRKFTTDLTTGFGERTNEGAGRFYRKDGGVNVIRKGVPFFDRFSWYHTMVSLPRWKFWAALFSAFIGVNLLFGTLYFFMGTEHLIGIAAESPLESFAEAFFFSAQTFTTVGYGRINPTGFLASALASLEAFLGVLSFALATGLFYGRFSMPKAFLYFSDVALFAPYKEGKALMFRMVPFKNNHLTEAEVKMQLALRIHDGKTERNEFYPLAVEFSRINVLVLNWTVVHPLNEESPMAQYTLADLKKYKAEILVFFKAYDEVFANTVVARTSYTADEIIPDARFKPMYAPDAQRRSTVLQIDKLNDFELLGKTS